MEEAKQALEQSRVKHLVSGKGRLVEVPYTASVGDTLHALQAHNILALPVAAPPGHWIGAGGSVVLESDKATGAARKHYIGIISTLDLFIHLAEAGASSSSQDFVSSLVSSPVSKVIGHSLEGLTLWCLSPHTTVLDAMEPLAKGLHRALVPLESQLEQHRLHQGLESIEASPAYRMLTQTDLVRFLRSEALRLRPILSRSVASLGAIQHSVFGVPEHMSLSDTMRCMTQASLAAVAIFPSSSSSSSTDPDEDKQLISGKGKRIIGTFSASDLRGCTGEVLVKWGPVGVLSFLKRDPTSAAATAGQVTCYPNASLEEVINRALDRKVHRVWVVEEGNEDNILIGLISFSDILRVVRHECTVP